MSEPDFLSNVETNRFQHDVESQRYQTRLLEKKKAFWSETIKLQFATSQQPPIIRIWKIPRFRLTKSFVEDCCNRAWTSFQKTNSTSESESTKLLSRITSTDKTANAKPPKMIPLMLSHLHHRESNTVIMPADMQSQCRAGPLLYEVVVRSAGGISSGGLLSSASGVRRINLEQRLGSASRMESHYDGDLCFVLHNVPKTSENRRFVVTENDIRRWIIEGCTKDDSMTVPMQKLEKALVKLEKDRKVLVAIGSRAENLTFINNEIRRTKNQLELAKLALQSARSKHFSECHLSIILQPSKLNEIKASWKVRVKGIKKEYYQKLIENYTIWVAMYAFGDPKAKTKSYDTLDMEHFVMSVPERDQADHVVDVGAVEMEMLPNGFGVYESFVTSCIVNDSDDDYGRHCLYHGHFHEGAMNGEGTLYTDEGVYYGEFRADERFGIGVMEYSDGITLSGDFALPQCSNVVVTEDEDKGELGSPMGPNPYGRGLPHGYVLIHFANGDEYEGEMRNGTITGHGVLRCASEE
ncbi:hypothetical protein HJC23_001165 [Cyclotella cryptica]|uniref:MORN repeat-containing protein n=1 Tax=Cyclotella cryptica TaxID=29204 RepID=A0ABD3QNH6_9STRA